MGGALYVVPVPEHLLVACDMQGCDAKFLLYASVGGIAWAVCHGCHDPHVPGVQLFLAHLTRVVPDFSCVVDHWENCTGEGKFPDVEGQPGVVEDIVHGSSSFGAFFKFRGNMRIKFAAVV